ncbi:hypothetical protein AB0H71_13610 [Nocardia sp. NPDC050697]|uniref:hypothetical protein n=1 Tax=Nocardia sp. NPDC050697 TaxID=3155158 RepID=UPI0033EEF397
MTVISEAVEDIAGADDTTSFIFAVPALRDSGTGMVTTRTIRLKAHGGVLTTPDLQPGPADVSVGLKTYHIEIPDWPTSIRLSPLIAAALPVAPAEEIGAVRNGGGVAIAKRHTLAEYEALPSIDPETLYVVPE